MEALNKTLNKNLNKTELQGSTLERALALYGESRQLLYQRTDQMFAVLMIVQWIAGIVAAYLISPKTWAGSVSQTHPHVWAAIVLGGAISSLPVFLALTRPGAPSTRYVIATAQMLMGGLLIHISGGRIETHFHVFGSLAFLACYRDWRVLIPATLVVAADHILRGVFWPQSIYGVLTASSWRWVEHAGWVIFEDIFLVISCLRSQEDMWHAAEQKAELVAREERYRSVVEQTDEGICLFDAIPGRIIESNDAFCHLLGYRKEEISGLTEFEFLKSATGAPLDLAELQRQRQSAVLERRHSRPRGSAIVFNISINTISYGGTDALCIVIHDITTRKAAEEALRRTHDELEQRVEQRTAALAAANSDLQDEINERKKVMEALRNYEDIFQNANTGIYQITMDGHCVTANPMLVKILGDESTEDLRARMANDDSRLYVDPARHDVYARVIEENNEVTDFESEIIRRDGSRIWVSENALAMRDHEGKLTGFQGTMIEITDRKRIEAELQRARDMAIESARLKSEFLANMSHEIRTPMNGVIGMTGLLLDTDLTEEQREFTETIRGSADSLLTIINDILDFSKIEAGRLHFETIDFDFSNVVESAVELLAEKAHTKGLELASLVYNDVPVGLRGDPGRLRQVLTNLIGNAVKFTEHGEVIVRVAKVSETDTHIMTRFTICDTGIGINESTQGALFQAFVQADGSTTRRYGGTGLGLAISKQLVALMGGEIGVESTLGKGSTFWFTAKFEKQPPRELKQAPVMGSLKNKRVLIVDDNATNRKILIHQVTGWEMIPDQAESGPIALRLMREAVDQGRPYDLAILDLMMPDMDGFEIAEAIKTEPQLASTALVMLTSFGRRSHTDIARELGIAAYQTKPVRQSQLFDCLSRVMGETANGADVGVSDRKPLFTATRLDASQKIEQARKAMVLLAEDNIVNQKVSLRQLQKLGYTADVAANGLEAVCIVKQAHYDLIFMDCQMPEMDGYEATAEIRRLQGAGKRTPIVAMTAHALAGDREKCLAAQMDDYLTKPIKIDELEAVLRRWLPAARDESVTAEEGAEDRTAPVDMARLSTVLGDTPEEIQEILEIYFRQMTESITQISAAIEANAANRVQMLAHNCAGASANCGMVRVVQPLRELERLGKEGRLHGAEQLNDQVAHEFDRIRLYIQEQMPAFQPSSV